jgi:hypothetical protein
MNLLNSLKKMVLVAVLLTAGIANATVLQFDLTGDYTASFKLDTADVPSDYDIGAGFVQFNVAGFFAGSLNNIANVTFFNASLGGGLRFDEQDGSATLLITNGPQLYTGLENAPTFLLGTFPLTEFDGTGVYALTIAEVPEPATGAMLLGGLAVMAALRKRKYKA